MSMILSKGNPCFNRSYILHNTSKGTGDSLFIAEISPDSFTINTYIMLYHKKGSENKNLAIKSGV
jgi:hypothetical protein